MGKWNFTEMLAKKNEFAMHRHIMVTYIYLGVCSKLGVAELTGKKQASTCCIYYN